MNILLDIPEDILKVYKKMAKARKLTRKKWMETVLIHLVDQAFIVKSFKLDEVSLTENGPAMGISRVILQDHDSSRNDAMRYLTKGLGDVPKGMDIKIGGSSAGKTKKAKEALQAATAQVGKMKFKPNYAESTKFTIKDGKKIFK